MNDHDIERLCTGYRVTVEEPPYGALDRLVLHAAARRARNRRLLRALLGAPTLTATALVLVLTGAAAVMLAAHHRAGTATLAAADHIRTDALTAGHPRPAGALRLTMITGQWTQPPAGRMQLQPIQALAPLPAAPLPRLAPPPARPVARMLAAPVRTVGVARAAGMAGVDLNVPGTLDALKSQRPADYARIMAILAGLQQHSNGDVPRWMATAFNARDVVYEPLWLTSFPPKRRLSFSLDDTRYRVIVTMTQNGTHVLPVQDTTGNMPGR